MNGDMKSKAICHIFIYDFDDTLFPHSQTNSTNFSEFEDSVFKLLSRSQDKGQVYILTNAQEEWVVKTIKNYMPRLTSLTEKLKIISSRDIFSRGRKYASANDLLKWKTLAMNEILIHADSSVKLSDQIHIISIGDSIIERQAAISATMLFSNYTGINRLIRKTIKLTDKPTMKILKKELEELDRQLDYIANCSTNLDLIFTPVYIH